MTMTVNATVVDVTETLAVLEALDEPIVLRYPGSDEDEPARAALYSNTEGKVTRVRLEIHREPGGPELRTGDVLTFHLHFGPEARARRVDGEEP